MGDYDNTAITHAQNEACAANTNLPGGVKIYSVGMFDPSFASGCSEATTTLNVMSACGNGATYIGTSKSQLETIFSQF